MTITPPSEKATDSPGRSVYALRFTAVLIALFCGWQVAGLPGALIRKYDPPFDMPWYGFGVKQVAIDAAGAWHIVRLGYADRSTYYVIRPELEPEKFFHVPTQLHLLDLSGNLNQQSVRFGDAQLSIKASRQYWAWRYRLKNLATTNRERARAYAADGSQDIIGPAIPMEPNAKLILADPLRHEFHVLEGYQYYPVLDAAAAISPNVWVSTERGRNLHRLIYRDTPGDLYFENVETRKSHLAEPLAHSCALAFQSKRDLVAMLKPSGEVDYYDPLSLEYSGSEQLPGNWRREYGELLYFGAGYSFYQGQPLSEAGYNRIMRGLMLVFLLSLLYFAVSWSKAWISTSGRTTGDTTQSSS